MANRIFNWHQLSPGETDLLRSCQVEHSATPTPKGRSGGQRFASAQILSDIFFYPVVLVQIWSDGQMRAEAIPAWRAKTIVPISKYTP